MDGRVFLVGITACVFSVSAFAGYDVEKTTDIGNDYIIYTQSMQGLDIAKDKNEIYYKLSQMSFTNHILYQRYLIGNMESSNKDVVRDVWCLNKRYNCSLYNTLSGIVASVLTNRDADRMEEIKVADLGTFKIVKGTKIENLTVAELNYTILYNFVDKHLLKLLDRDKIKDSVEESDFKSKWYHWDDEKAKKGIAAEQLLLMKYVTEKFDANDERHLEIQSRIMKSKDDCMRYVYACQLHQYITIQNVLTYRARKFCGMETGFAGVANYKYKSKNKDSNYEIKIAGQYVEERHDDVGKQYYLFRPASVLDTIKGNDKEIAELLNGACFIQPSGDSIKKLYAITYATPYATITQLGEREKTKKYQGINLDPNAKYVMNIIAGRPLSKLLTHSSDDYSIGSINNDPYDVYFGDVELSANSGITKLKRKDGSFFYTHEENKDAEIIELYDEQGAKFAEEKRREYVKGLLQKGDITNTKLFDINYVASVVGTYGKSITNKLGNGAALGLLELHFGLTENGGALVDNKIETSDTTDEGESFKTAYEKQLNDAVYNVTNFKK